MFPTTLTPWPTTTCPGLAAITTGAIRAADHQVGFVVAGLAP